MNVNVILGSVNVLAVVGAAAIWFSPRAAMRLSAKLWARGQALKASREAYWRTYRAELEQELGRPV